MSLYIFTSLFHRFTTRWPLLIYAVTWTTLLIITVAIASFTPEIAFVAAIAPSSSFALGCGSTEVVLRVPLDLPGERFCLPAHLFKGSEMDLLVPPVFAAVVVAGSACFVKALGLWEND